MRQLMRPLICSNVLALRLALVVGISFLACNTFSSKLILTSHESLTYFLYFFPPHSSLEVFALVLFPCLSLFSCPRKEPNPIQKRRHDQHTPDNSRLITPICSRARPYVMIYFIHGNARHSMGIQSTKRWTLLHMRITISLFMSAASVTTIWYLRHPQTVLMCITMSLFAFYSYTHHRVMEG